MLINRIIAIALKTTFHHLIFHSYKNFQITKLFPPICITMLKILNSKLRRLVSHLRWPIPLRRSKPKIVIKRFGKTSSKSLHPEPPAAPSNTKQEPIINSSNGSASVHPNSISRPENPEKRIRIATFNAALFSMAPAVPDKSSSHLSPHSPDEDSNPSSFKDDLGTKSVNDRPKSILKQSPLHPNTIKTQQNLPTQQKYAKSKLRVSINLPDNEISLLRNRQMGFVDDDETEPGSLVNMRSKSLREKRSNSVSFRENGYSGCNRTVLEVLKELDADVLALQDVKAEEEKCMKPLSDLAEALGMYYVFAESWAPEYGNAIFSKWPIKRWEVQKIFDDSDFRNVLKATIEVPHFGEVNFHCTHLDHLDENWRMKQINAIIQSSSDADEPHILAGGLNSLEETDYSPERWTDIVKYYEEMGKPTPKAEVMRFLRSKQYTDAKDFAGECEPVVMIAKGQSVQGTCKYGTRLDYILTSPTSPYKFVPGSYSVLSSKGTSDHHIVKVDIMKVDQNGDIGHAKKSRMKVTKKVVKITNSSLPKGIRTT